MRRRNKWLLILGIVVVLLVAARLALEPILLDYANKKLNALNAYDGHIDDLDLSLLRGGYNIKGIEIVKTGSGQPVPFFKADRIEATIEWRSLLHGQLVAEADLFRPQANLVQAETEQQSQLGKEVNWVEQFKQLFPFRFNTVRVHDGTVTFRAPGIQTKDALTARHIEGLAREPHERRGQPQGNVRGLPVHGERARRRLRESRRRRRSVRGQAYVRPEPAGEERAAAAGEPVADALHQGRRRERRVRAVHWSSPRRTASSRATPSP